MNRIFLSIAVFVTLCVASSQTLPPHIPFNHIVIDTNGPRSIHSKGVGDINGDGFQDLVVAGTGGGIYWYADPSWTRHTVALSGGGWSADIEVADIDRDGRNDLVVSDWYQAQRIGWFKNPGPSGAWVFRVIGAPRAHDIEVDDLDGDGDIDVVTRQQTTPGAAIELWRQNSPTSWSRRTLVAPAGEGLTLGDVDMDGDKDVVIGGRWYENTGDILGGSWGQWVFANNWTHPHTFPALGDMNGDGRPDVVLTPSEKPGNTYRTSWYEAPANPKQSRWAEHVIESPVEGVTHALAIADMDRDGDLDVVTAEMHRGSDPDEVRVYVNASGNGLSWTKQIVSTRGSHNIRIVDIGNDGDLDIFGANFQSTGQVDLWENMSQGSAAAPAASDSSPPSTPATVAAIPVSGTQIHISWSQSNDNVGVAGYRVIRDGTPVATANVTAYTDGALVSSTTYSYRVTAFDAAGNESAPSALVSATTMAAGGSQDSTPPVVSGVTVRD
jgi:chitodextrinase